MAYQDREPIKFPIEFGGLAKIYGVPLNYPHATEAFGVRFRTDGGVERAPGLDYWNKQTLAGTVTVATNSHVVTGVGTAFLTDFAVADIITITDTNESRTITVVTDDTHMTMFSPYPAIAAAGSAYSGTYIIPPSDTEFGGLFQFNKNDATTKYLVGCTHTGIYTLPQTGQPVNLATGISGPAKTDFWDGTVFNNELILTTPAIGPYVTDGTAAGTGLLVRTTYMQARTAMNTARAGYGQLGNINGMLFSAGGDTGDGNPTTETYCRTCERYDPIGNTWTTMIGLNIGRTQHAGFSGYGRYYVNSGLSAAGTFCTYGEYYDSVKDAWISYAQTTATSKRMVSAAGINNNGHVIFGNNDHTNDTTGDSTTTNTAYDPAANTWTAKTAGGTAKRQTCTLNIGHMAYVFGGATNDTPLNTAEKYDPFANAYTAMSGTMAAARKDAGGAGSPNGYGYMFGGDSGTQPTETVLNSIERYDPISNTSAAVATSVLATAKTAVAGGQEGYWIYAAGGMSGATAATPNGQMDRLNTSPNPPTAYYCCSYTGYLFLARSSTYPSRVWYSEPGDATQWPANNWFDINPDDGDWITAIFVWDNKLYISKRETIYQITGTVFDPSEGDFGYYPLAGTEGAVAQHSVSVTDVGVFLVGTNGIHLFDGARCTNVFSDVLDADTVANLFGSGHINEACAAWHKNEQEVWFILYQGDYSLGVPWIYNYEVKKWSWHYGFARGGLWAPRLVCRALDSTDNNHLLFASTDLVPIDLTGDSMPSAAWATDYPPTGTLGQYRTGYFYPAGPGTEVSGAYLDIWHASSGSHLCVYVYGLNGGLLQTFTDIDLTAGKSRLRLSLDANVVDEAFSIKIQDLYNEERFIIYAMQLIGHKAQSRSTVNE